MILPEEELDVPERLVQLGIRIEAITAATHSVIDMLDKYMHSSLATFKKMDEKLEKLNEKLNLLSARVSGIEAKGVLLESRHKGT